MIILDRELKKNWLFSKKNQIEKASLSGLFLPEPEKCFFSGVKKALPFPYPAHSDRPQNAFTVSA
jgi:hypothetical protein